MNGRGLYVYPVPQNSLTRKRRSTQRLSAGGDSPCEIIFSVKTLWIPLAAISRGECYELPHWSNLSVETTHLSR